MKHFLWIVSIKHALKSRTKGITPCSLTCTIQTYLSTQWVFNTTFPPVAGLFHGPYHQRQYQLLPDVQEGLPSPASDDGPQPRCPPWPRGLSPTVLRDVPQRIATHVSQTHYARTHTCAQRYVHTHTDRCMDSHTNTNTVFAAMGNFPEVWSTVVYDWQPLSSTYFLNIITVLCTPRRCP